jgi:anti-anti-sigma regulatory factor
MAKTSEVPSDIIQVAEQDHTAYIRMRGRATFMLASDFKTYVTMQVEDRQRGVLIDLSECETIDSTFIGTITSLSLKYRKTHPGCVKLFNISSHVREILSTLGLITILDVVNGNENESVAFSEMAPGDQSRVDVAHLMLDAHQTLSGINRENALEFKNVVEYLQKQIK